MGNKAHPPQNKRSHDRLTDIWFSRDQFTKLLSIEAQYTAVFAHATADQNLSIIEQIDLSSELMFSVYCKYVQPISTMLVDLDTALQHDKEINATLPSLK
jgi:hypothetical protein